MTLIGAWFDGRDRGYVWADSECYFDGQPDGHVQKLFVNKETGVAGCGTGTVSMMDSLKMVLVETEPVPFDRVVRRLCSHLRQEHAAAHNLRLNKIAEAMEGWKFIVAGWSERLFRIAVLHADANYEPQFAERVAASPYISELKDFSPSATGDFLPIARAQMHCIKRQIPGAGAGTLTVARLFRGGVFEMAYEHAFE
jgi:hypothetical protein